MLSYLKRKILDLPFLKKVMPQKYIVDTCIFGKILDGSISKNDLPADGVFLITHVQLGEINNAQDSEKRARLLLNLFALPVTIVLTESCITNVSRVGYSKACHSVNYCNIKELLDKRNGGKNNNKEDALIADTAMQNGYTLISADEDLIAVTNELGCKTIFIQSNQKLRVCHVTSVHNRYDARIFKKECGSLAKNGYDVVLLVNDGQPDETLEGVRIVSTKVNPGSRFERILGSLWGIKNEALSIGATVYHLHDPELLPLGIWLKKNGKTVIFDSHEDYLLAILDKVWIPSFFRRAVAKLFQFYEAYALKRFDGAVTCYHWTEARYRKYCDNVELIFNFPIVKADVIRQNVEHSKRAVCFAGVIISDWCHKEILQALSELKNVKYELAGRSEGDYFKELKAMEAWKHVNYHGSLSQEKVFKDVYGNASIGMALLDYVAQCNGKVGNLSNTKFFEYMLMGLPLVCTDFELWKKIVEEEKCGICVNPHNPVEIASAIGFFLDNPQEAQKMGENGRKAVIERYNWNTEKLKLLSLYQKLIAR